MTVQRGSVRADGTSTIVPREIYDMTTIDPELTPEIEEKLQTILSAFDPRESKAQFKLEAFLLGGPRKTVDVKGLFSFYTNGGFLNGGGDAGVYLCPQVIEPGKHCYAPIDAQFITAGKAVCTACRRVTDAKELVGQLVVTAPISRWAQLMVRFFYALNCSADVVLNVERQSLRRATQEELERHRGGERYAAVARERECIVYPLANIIQDTASGAGLETRFRAFLEA